MKSLLSVLSVTVLVAPPCALAGIVVRASERVRRAKDPRRPRRGTFEQARRGTSPSGRGAIHCDRSRRASCRSTRSARRHEGTEEVESWFTSTSITCCLIPRLGKACSLSDAPRRAVRRWGTSGVGLSWRTRWRMKPRASQPQNHSPCPRASPCSVLTGRRPGPRSGSLSYATCRGRAAEDVGPYHPSCPDAAWRAKDPRRPRRGTSERVRRAKDPRRPRHRAVRTGPAREGLAPPRHRAVRRWRGTARRDRFVVDEKAAFARRGGNGAGVTRKGGRVL